MPPTPRLTDAQAFKIIARTIGKKPTSRQRDLVERLMAAGGAEMTAYRQVKRFFQQGRGGAYLPHVEQARVQITSVLEEEIAEGVSNPASARLYAEATGVLEPPADTVDEPARLKAAAEATAVLLGLQKESKNDS